MDLLKQVRAIKREQLEVEYLLTLTDKIRVENELIESHRDIRTLQRKVRRLSASERSNDQVELCDVD